MENKTDNPFYNKKVQDILSKLISEEMLANMTYRNAIMAGFDVEKMPIDNFPTLNKPFQTIADDELSDHHKALVFHFKTKSLRSLLLKKLGRDMME